MTLTEQRILKSVQILPAQSAVNVQWSDQVMRGDEIIAETYRRKTYTQDQKAEFVAEVEGAQNYAEVLGW